MGIDRLRIGTDGQGITSLITFYGCPLKCNYCLNPQCHNNISESSYIRSDELYDQIKIDELYYLATGGGITFGGGEPLLYSNFIAEVLDKGAKKWNITVETSLHIPFAQIDVLLPYINELIVDVKDMEPSIYKLYTQSDNEIVIDNLKRLAKMGYADKVLIRLPYIKGFNTKSDIIRSKKVLEQNSYIKFDMFDYLIDV